MNTITNALSELGLGENEAVLYEVLLKYPHATIPLLQEKSPFSRTMLYYVLEQLEEWELLTKGKEGKKTTYNAEPPEKLLSLIDEQYKEIKRRKALVSDILPDLRSSYRLGHNKPGIRFYEGKEGFAEALHDSLSAQETIYTYVDVDSLSKFARDINEAYAKKRQKKGVGKKLLIVDTPEARAYMKTIGRDHTTTRFLPADMTPFRTGMQIYDGKIAYFTLREENILSVIIEDPDIYTMHRHMFEFLWNLQKQTKRSTALPEDAENVNVWN